MVSKLKQIRAGLTALRADRNMKNSASLGRKADNLYEQSSREVAAHQTALADYYKRKALGKPYVSSTALRVDGSVSRRQANRATNSSMKLERRAKKQYSRANRLMGY